LYRIIFLVDHMNGQLKINKYLLQLKLALKSKELFLVFKSIILSIFLALFMRMMSVIPLTFSGETGFDIFFDFKFYSISEGSIPFFVLNALLMTLKLVMLAWILSIVLGLVIVYLKNKYFKFDPLWEFFLGLSGIHVFGLIVSFQIFSSNYNISFPILVFILAIGSGSLKDIVNSFEFVYKDVMRKEYWRFMYSQGVKPFRIGFSELLVRFTELSFNKLPILLVGSILVEVAANKQGLGFHLLRSLKNLEENRGDLNVFTGITFTLIFLVLLSQHITEYVRMKYDPQSFEKR